MRDKPGVAGNKPLFVCFCGQLCGIIKAIHFQFSVGRGVFKCDWNISQNGDSMKRWVFWFVLLIWVGGSGFSFGAARVYAKAVQFARAGQAHFAFMQYNNLLRAYPTSQYRSQAIFATGEYYYQIANYQDAQEAFKFFLDENPDSKERLYALAYLLSIAQKNAASAEELERTIINLQQVSLVFREKKEITYRSPLYQDYKTVIHINKIEFYVEGKLFAKVSF